MILNPNQNMSVLDIGNLNGSPEISRVTTLADTGTFEVTTVTCPTAAALTAGDYVHFVAKDGTKFAVWSDKDGAGLGVQEATTVTFPSTAGATQNDYVHMTAADGTKCAVYLDIDTGFSGVAEVATATFDTAGNATHGDFLHITNQAARSAIVWLNKDGADDGLEEITTVTFPNTAGATQADYLHILNQAGRKTAIWLDIDANGTAPTGALYLAADSTVQVDIVTGNTATQVAAAAVAAMGSLPGLTILDNLDGTVTFTQTAVGVTTDAAPKSENDAGAGSIGVAITRQGTAASVPGGAIAAAASDVIKVDITTGQTATQVATAAVAAISTTLADITVLDNLDGTVTFTQDVVGVCTDAAPYDLSEGGAGSITVNKDTEGVAIVAAPAGALYAAADVQVRANIATGDTATQVATKAVAAIGSSFTGITILDNLDGTVLFTNNGYASVADALPKNTGDTGAGSITVVVDVNGVDPVPPTGALYVASDYQIRFAVTTGDTATIVRDSMLTAMGLSSELIALATPASSSTDAITLTHLLLGNAGASAPKDENDAGAGSITVAKVDGVASSLQSKYITFSSPTVNYYAYININSEAVDPAPGGTGISCACTNSGSIATIASEMATAINGNSYFKAWVQAGYLYIAAVAAAEATDVGAGDSGFTVLKVDDGETGYYYPGMSPGSLSVSPSLIT